MNIIAKAEVYIIIPVHNRKDITLKCLENLEECGDLARYHTVIVDDGSSDGTTEAIHSRYPEVTVLAGDGNLWWTGAIQKGMEYAYGQGAEYFVWLNDDCYPQKNTIRILISQCRQNHRSLLGIQCLDPGTLEPTYGGILTQNNFIQPIYNLKNELLECDGLNGNLACIPREVVDTIGFPNAKKYPHHFGDFIYTKQAQKFGYKILLCGEVIAFCKKNRDPYESWIIPERSLLELWNSYFIPDTPNHWKFQLYAYWKILGLPGIWYWFYQRVIKFWLIFLLIYPLPLSLRKKIRQID